MLKNLLVIISSLGIFTAAGCGDDDKGSGSGVDPDKQANKLTQEEINAICKNRVERFEAVTKSSEESESNKRGLCVYGGLLGAYFYNGDKIVQCETIRDECIQDASDAGSGTPDAGAGQTPPNCPTVATAATCDARVSDIDACTDGQVAEYQKLAEKLSEYLNGLTCEKAGQPIDQAAVDEFINQTTTTTDIPSCTGLFTNCPFLRLSR